MVLRPVAPISIVGREVAPVGPALVDSGCEHVLAAPWVARAALVDLDSSTRKVVLGLGGEVPGQRGLAAADRRRDHIPAGSRRPWRDVGLSSSFAAWVALEALLLRVRPSSVAPDRVGPTGWTAVQIIRVGPGLARILLWPREEELQPFTGPSDP